MEITSRVLSKLTFSDFVLSLSVILVGGFNEYIACILSAIMTVYLFVKLIKNKKLYIKTDLLSVSVMLICLMYGVSALWAIDSGMAFIGFLKFLPLIFYLITLWQSETVNIQKTLPYLSAVLVIVSVIGMYISATAPYFSVAGRLAGFFQYPNSFALFLLVCELMLISAEKLKIADYICLVIITAGILYTGSRTVFVLWIVSGIVVLVYRLLRGNKKKTLIFTALVFAVVCAVVFIINRDAFGRLTDISLADTTFVGRLLYWKDAMPLTLRYPFGMGYMGYSYVQHSIQSGVYSVQYVHNDFLQLVLDIGWVPALVFIFAVLKTLFGKNDSFDKKIIIAVICIHSFFDFDLQFLAIFFILLTLLDNSADKKIEITKKRTAFGSLVVVALVAAVYMGTHLALSYFQKYNTAEQLYPWNTENKISMLERETDINRANVVADRILEQNTHSYIPYSIKAKYFYSQGNFTSLINYKRMVFEKTPLEYTEYEEYCRMLINGIALYEKAGDFKSVSFCQTELIRTKALLEKNSDLISELGNKIKDKPITELPEEISEYISSLENKS